MNKQISKELFMEAAQLSMEMINFMREQRPDLNQKLGLFALAIAYATLCKGTDVNLHSAVELIMTIYKHTEIEHE